MMRSLPSLWGRRFVRHWAQTIRGQRTLEELLDLGYSIGASPGWWEAGAWNFDPGSSEYISRSVDDDSLDVADGDSIIVQALFKLDAVGTEQRFIAGKGNSTTVRGWQIYMGAGESVFFQAHDGTDLVASPGVGISAGTWYAATGILTANALADDDASIYLDSALSGPNNSTVLGSCTTASVFAAGAASNGGIRWDGDIAYVRVWKLAGAAWTAAQRSQVVEAQNRLYLPAAWGPGTQALQWILWDSAIGSPRDYSGNGLTGTVNGTPTFVDDPRRVMGPGGGLARAQKAAAAVAAKKRRMLLGVGH